MSDCWNDGYGWCPEHDVPWVTNPLDPAGERVCASTLGITSEMVKVTPLGRAHQHIVEKVRYYEENYHKAGDCDHSDCLMDDDRLWLRRSVDDIEQLWVTRIRDLLPPDDPDRISVEDHLNTLRGTL